MNADLRGFAYPLQALHVRQQWRLDAIDSRVAVVLRELAQAQERRERQTAELDLCLQALSIQDSGSWNAPLRVASLRWLARQRAALQAMDRVLETLCEQRASLLAERLACQARLDVLDEHRGAALRDFKRIASTRAAAQADRDWLARMEPTRT